jgi:ABC-type glycerol-3-phosphate transport system permease component
MAATFERRVAGERHRTIGGLQFTRLVLYLIAVGLAVTLTWPFFWAVSSSLKEPGEIYMRPPVWIPAQPQFYNYVEIWERVPFGQFLRNSLFITFFAVVGQVLSCTGVAYGFARFRFPARDLLFGLALATLMLPREVTIIPLFLIFRQLGWLNTPLPLIVPYWLAGGAFFIFLMRQFFMTIPHEFDEAAQIDGASSWWILWRVILPLAKPAVATATIFSFLSHWNEFWGPLIFLNSPEQFTLPIGLRWLQTTPQGGQPMEHLLLAGAITAVMPVIALYFCAQKYFVQGIVMSGIKG